MASVASFLILIAGSVILVLSGLMLAARRDRRRWHVEADRLRDEIWELREAAASRDRAQAANEAKSRFLANVSHEVRTPLNGILGMAELLVGTTLDAEQDTYVAAIRSSGSALASLVDEILDFSKIEAGKVDLLSESFDPVRLLEGVVELLAPRAQGKDLEIAASVAADVPRSVRGDPVRLRQILLNLAGNAVKFTSAGGIGVRITRANVDGEGESVALRFDVEDTGPGVPPERRTAIFEDFEQAGGAASQAGGGIGSGTGLGLAIARRLAERMGGSLGLAERTGGGSCFTLHLPLPPADAPAGQMATDALAPQVPALAACRVLIASASPFEAPFLAACLTQAGATVTRLADAEAARCHLLAQPPFDMVMMDCSLGEAALGGLGDAARGAGARRLVVLFSPFERRAFGQAAGRGFDGWLVKPVRRQTLFALLDSTLGSALAPTPAAPPLEPQPLSTAAGRFAVLLAEDNEINALLAMRHLGRLGASVAHAPDGLAALALAEAAMDAGSPFPAAVLDLRMPGLGGLEVARRLRLAETARGLPPSRLIVLSADLVGAGGQSEAQLLARQSGVDVFVGKPVTFAQLASSLAPVLERSESQAATVG